MAPPVPATTEPEGKFRRWALRHGVGALPCRSAHGFPANRVYGAMLHNVFEWYKHDFLGKEEQARRLPTVVQRDFAVAPKSGGRGEGTRRHRY